MGRYPTKAAGNIYCQCRKRAAQYNDKLNSREGAAELLGVSPSTVADYELGTTGVIPVEKVVLMADLYNAPELENHYCRNECPIGRDLPIEAEPIERVTLQFIKQLSPERIDAIQKRLIAIAEDGCIDEEEKRDLREALKEIDKIEKVLQDLLLLGEKALRGGGDK